MKKYLLNFLFLFLFAQISIGQSFTTSVGAGVAFSHFQRVESDPILQQFQQFSPHFHVKLESRTKRDEGLIGQLQANFYQKSISLGYRYDNLSGGSVTEAFRHNYLSSDIVITAGYNTSFGGNIGWQPRLGFFFSFNQYIGTTEFSSVSGGGSNPSQYSFDIETDESPFFIYPGIITGVSFIKPLKNGQTIRFFTDFYFAPRNIFSEPFEYTINGGLNNLQGKYHYVNAGFRFSFTGRE